jgi:hypothetical protein
MSSKSRRGRGRIVKGPVVRFSSTPKIVQQPPSLSIQPQNRPTSQWDFDFVVSPPKASRNNVVEENDLFDDDDDDVIGPSQTIESDDAGSSPTSPILTMSEPAIKRLRLGSPKVNRYIVL